MSTPGKIKVLIVDDSALVRKTLREWINAQTDMEVISVAADPFVAVEKMKTQRPDVITLDIEMPRMDGLTFLRKLMMQHPIPVIVVSSLSTRGGEVAMKALEYGAVDVFLKDDIRLISNGEYGYTMLLDRIRAAGHARVRRQTKQVPPEQRLVSELTSIRTSEKVIVLGASTGGTAAIHDIVKALPPDSPGMVVVQHMPKAFTKFFAERLHEQSALTIKEAEDGDSVVPGRVLIAPGDRHVKILRQGVKVIVKTWDGPFVNRHKPSIDVLFESAADQLGRNAVGVLLTGMGRDGADGLLSMKKKGAFTIAQDEATSVVYGMPKEAVKLNAVDKILPLDQIPTNLYTPMDSDSQHPKNDKDLAEVKQIMKEQIRHYTFQNDHIMRGPLCRVMGLLELLRHEDLSPDARKVLDMLMHETRQIENVTFMISKMLDEYEGKLNNDSGHINNQINIEL